MRARVPKRKRLPVDEDHEAEAPTECRSKMNEDRPACLLHFKSTANKYSFEAIYRKRKIVTGRCFVRSFLSNIGFVYLERLENWGWMNLITMERSTYENLVKYFYFNGRLEKMDEHGRPIGGTKERDGFYTFAQNTDMHVAEDDVWEALGRPIKTTTAPQYDKKTFRHDTGCGIIYGRHDWKEGVVVRDIKKLPFHNRILHFMVCQSLVPRLGSYADIFLKDIWLLSTIILGTPPNLHELVMEKLKLRVANKEGKRNNGLPYGKVVSQVIDRKLGGKSKDTVLAQDTLAPFKSVSQTGFLQDPNTGHWYRKDDKEAENIAGSEDGIEGDAEENTDEEEEEDNQIRGEGDQDNALEDSSNEDNNEEHTYNYQGESDALQQEPSHENDELENEEDNEAGLEDNEDEEGQASMYSDVQPNQDSHPSAGMLNPENYLHQAMNHVLQTVLTANKEITSRMEKIEETQQTILAILKSIQAHSGIPPHSTTSPTKETSTPHAS